MKYLILVTLALIGLQSCSTSGPREINYGQESCTHCKMVISDKRFGAELINTKGKVFTFDAIECMLSYLKAGQIDADNVKDYYVIDATNAGTLIEATKAYYVVGDQVRSPMGGNIAAAFTEDGSQKLAKEFAAKIINWEELLLRSNEESTTNFR